MSIHVNEATNLFHLQTAHTSYIFRVLENGELGQIYYGDRIPVKAAYPNLTRMEEHDCTNTLSEEQNDFQLEMIKQEYASFGKGDYRTPAYQITGPNGSRITEFDYAGYELSEGKERLGDLPASFDDDHHDSQTLTVKLVDHLLHLELALHYTVFEQEDVLVRSATFTNHGAPVFINRAMSAQLDLRTPIMTSCNSRALGVANGTSTAITCGPAPKVLNLPAVTPATRKTPSLSWPGRTLITTTGRLLALTSFIPATSRMKLKSTNLTLPGCSLGSTPWNLAGT